jgi:alpha,alpha-trehalose phosphorylase
MVYRVQAKAGQSIKVTKVVSYHTSRGVPSRELVDRCRRTLDRVYEHGVEPEFAAQREWLDRFWERSDVVVHGQPVLQQAIRWNLFQVAQATARAEQSGVPSKGVTGTGYSGHYFWDTEIFVVPFLTYTSPQMARSELRFRYNMLDAARRRAEELAQSGALFPWRTVNGEEASAYYAAGTAQYHIDADIAYALCKYVAASGDQDFMNREGVDILVDTARLWADLGFWRENGTGRRSFHIHGVTGPDEYTTVVNDNLFTNVMARYNLAQAAELLRQLKRELPRAYQRVAQRLELTDEEIEEWAECAQGMSIPYDKITGINPQDAHFLDREVWDLKNTPPEKRPLLLHYHPLVIYRFQVLKQADVVLALFLQGDHFSNEQKRNNFEYYDPITTGDSTLSGIVQSIIAAEVGYRDLALRYFYNALFVDLADLHGNTSDGVHVASTGGVWNILAYGFGGMRDYNGKITFDPRLPESWAGLTFQVTLRGTRLKVDLTSHEIAFTVVEGESVALSVRGDNFIVVAGTPVRVPVADQGPWIRSPVPSRTVDVRPDGTRITASVPQAVIVGR